MVNMQTCFESGNGFSIFLTDQIRVIFFFLSFFLIWATGWDVRFSVCTKEGPCETFAKAPAEYLLLLHENQAFVCEIRHTRRLKNLKCWSRGHEPLKSYGGYVGSIIFSCTGQCWDFRAQMLWLNANRRMRGGVGICRARQLSCSQGFK